jgi:RNA polymerase sigma factor (sigma-70 family)
MCTLSDSDKSILRLHYLEDKDFRYIGDTLGLAEQTVKIRHRNALKKIKEALEL